VTGAQLPLASNAVFSGHVCVDGGGARPEGGATLPGGPLGLGGGAASGYIPTSPHGY
jgi:hypothetical protein